MRSFILLLVLCGVVHSKGFASDGEVIKVLPQFLDQKGHHALSPSLFERDAYQAFLRKHPAQISGVRFSLHWKAATESDAPLKLRIEVRPAKDISNPVIREVAVKKPRFGGRWSSIELVGKDYEAVGEILAWRASLLSGDRVIGEQSSFLW